MARGERESGVNGSRHFSPFSIRFRSLVPPLCPGSTLTYGWNIQRLTKYQSSIRFSLLFEVHPYR